jgi:hypothetical protein
MALNQQDIDVGASPNDGQGDPIRTAFIKCNDNFTQLYSLPQPTTPTTLVGQDGDIPGMYAYDSNYFYYCFAEYDGSSAIWGQVTQIGNVSVSALVNGTSNVKISTTNGNATISIGGTSNVAVFSTTGIRAQGIISTTGNVTGGNIVTGGNVTASFFLGDGSQLTGIPGSYGNSNVATYLASGTNSNNITTTGNVSGTYIIGDGSFLTNVSGGGSSNYTNANVAAYLPTYTGNLQGGNLNVINTFNIGGTPFTRTLTVGTRSAPVTVPLASNNSFNVVGRTGNVVVYTT